MFDMKMALTLLFVEIFGGGALIALIIYVQKKTKSKERSAANLRQHLRLYKFLSNNFLTRSDVRKIAEKIGSLSVYNPDDAKVMTVKHYLGSTGMAAAVVLASAVIFRDTFSVLIMLIYATVMRECLVFKKIDNTEFLLLKQMRITLASVRQSYMRTNSITDAIGEAEAPPLMVKPMQEIYNILTAHNRELRLDAFYASTPYHILQTLAGVCYVFTDTGDTKNANGESAFTSALDMMASDVGTEVRRITYQRSKFAALEFLPVLPVLLLGLVEAFFGKYVPGTSILYKGLYGYSFRVVIMLASLFCYYGISKMNTVQVVRKDDRSPAFMQLLKIPSFKRFIKDISPKKYKKVKYYEKLRNTSLSLKSLDLIMTGKVVAATLAFTFTILVCLFSVNLAKSFIYDNVRSLALSSSGEELTADDIRLRKSIDDRYLALPQRPTESQTQAIVDAYFPKMMDLDKADQVKRLMDKYDSYHNTYFKYWMVLLAYAAAFLGWKSQEIVLMVRRKVLTDESEEDLLQLQTFICILQSTSLDTLDVLYWMMKQSRVHKYFLMDCYYEYPSNPLMALGRLKSKSMSAEFRRLVDKLTSTVYEISMPDAFGDMYEDRSNIRQIREIMQRSSIDRKRAIASPMSLLPLVLVMLFYIVVPLGILGWVQFSAALSSMPS